LKGRFWVVLQSLGRNSNDHPGATNSSRLELSEMVIRKNDLLSWLHQKYITKNEITIKWLSVLQCLFRILRQEFELDYH